MNNVLKFEELGCLGISKDKDFADFLSELAPEIKAICPDYESGEVPSSPHTLLDTALQHRLDDYDLLPEQVVHENPLFGKRIITQAHDLPKKLIPLLEHSHILNHVSSILGTSEIVLINGSIHGNYPGSSEMICNITLILEILPISRKHLAVFPRISLFLMSKFF